jgi:hypothetical protein
LNIQRLFKILIQKEKVLHVGVRTKADSTDPVVRQWVGFDFSPSGCLCLGGETVNPLKHIVSKGHSFSCEFLWAGS